MSYDSRLFNVARLRAIVEITDDISDSCTTASDALSGYEQAEESGDREDAREEAWTAIEEILAGADRLRAIRETLYGDESDSDLYRGDGEPTSGGARVPGR